MSTITDVLIRQGNQGSFAAVSQLQGAWLSVNNYSDLELIDSSRLSNNQIVYVSSENKFYRVFITQSNDITYQEHGWSSVVIGTSSTESFAVTVDGSNLSINGVSNQAICLLPGFTYKFDLSDSTLVNHSLGFSTVSSEDDQAANQYTTGVTSSGVAGQDGSFVSITVTQATPLKLYYYCPNHANMVGGEVVCGTVQSIGTLNLDNVVVEDFTLTNDVILSSVNASNISAPSVEYKGSDLDAVLIANSDRTQMSQFNLAPITPYASNEELNLNIGIVTLDFSTTNRYYVELDKTYDSYQLDLQNVPNKADSAFVVKMLEDEVNIDLPKYYKGNYKYNRRTGSATLFHFVKINDEQVVTAYELLDEEVLLYPSTITDVSVDQQGSHSTLITFDSPTGSRIGESVDSYIVYASNSPINKFEDLTYLSPAIISYEMQAPGELQKILVSGLLPGMQYNLYVVGVVDQYSIPIYSAIANETGRIVSTTSVSTSVLGTTSETVPIISKMVTSPVAPDVDLSSLVSGADRTYWSSQASDFAARTAVNALPGGLASVGTRVDVGPPEDSDSLLENLPYYVDIQLSSQYSLEDIYLLRGNGDASNNISIYIKPSDNYFNAEDVTRYPGFINAGVLPANEGVANPYRLQLNDQSAVAVRLVWDNGVTFDTTVNTDGSFLSSINTDPKDKLSAVQLVGTYTAPRDTKELQLIHEDLIKIPVLGTPNILKDSVGVQITTQDNLDFLAKLNSNVALLEINANYFGDYNTAKSPSGFTVPTDIQSVDFVVSTMDFPAVGSFGLNFQVDGDYSGASNQIDNLDDYLTRINAKGVKPIVNLALSEGFNTIGALSGSLEDSSKEKGNDLAITTGVFPLATGDLTSHFAAITNPINYRSKAALVYEFVDRYGSVGTNAASTRQISRTDENSVIVGTYVENSGLDLVSGIQFITYPEFSINKYSTYEPEEVAAIYSACYDGHQGTLVDESGGTLFGAKTADSAMKVVLPIPHGVNVGFLEAMVAWWDTHRTDTNYDKYPFDVISYKQVLATEEYYDKDSTTFKSQDPDVVLERDFVRDLISYKQKQFTSKEIWTTLSISEGGSEATRLFSPGNVGTLHKSVVAASWLVKSILLLLAKGSNKVIIDSLTDSPNVNQYDHEPAGMVYGTQAYVEVADTHQTKSITKGLLPGYSNAFYPLRPKFGWLSTLLHQLGEYRVMGIDTKTAQNTSIQLFRPNTEEYAHVVWSTLEEVEGTEEGIFQLPIVPQDVDFINFSTPNYVDIYNVTPTEVSAGDHLPLKALSADGLTLELGQSNVDYTQPSVNGVIPVSETSVRSQLEAYQAYFQTEEGLEYLQGSSTSNFITGIVVTSTYLFPKILKYEVISAPIITPQIVGDVILGRNDENGDEIPGTLRYLTREYVYEQEPNYDIKKEMVEVSNLRITKLDPSRLEISWDTNLPWNLYEVYINDGVFVDTSEAPATKALNPKSPSGVKLVDTIATTSNKFILTDVLNSVTHASVAIRPILPGAELSNFVFAIISAEEMGYPTSLQVDRAFELDVLISWTHDITFTNANSGFIVYRSTSPTSGFTALATVDGNTTQYNDTNATGPAEYYYMVKAFEGEKLSQPVAAYANVLNNPNFDPPLFSSARLTPTKDAIIVEMNINVSVDATTGFALTQDGNAVTFTGVSTSANEITLSLASPVIVGAALELVYTAGTGDEILSDLGNAADSFTTAVSNTLPEVVKFNFLHSGTEGTATTDPEWYNVDFDPNGINGASTLTDVTNSLGEASTLSLHIPDTVSWRPVEDYLYNYSYSWTGVETWEGAPPTVEGVPADVVNTNWLVNKGAYNAGDPKYGWVRVDGLDINKTVNVTVVSTNNDATDGTSVIQVEGATTTEVNRANNGSLGHTAEFTNVAPSNDGHIWVRIAPTSDLGTSYKAEPALNAIIVEYTS